MLREAILIIYHYTILLLSVSFYLKSMAYQVSGMQDREAPDYQLEAAIGKIFVSVCEL